MKIAFYMQDGLEQLVLTPESEREKKMLALLHQDDRSLEIKRGAFYECRGGWVRFSGNGLNAERNVTTDDDSTMLVLRTKVKVTNV